MLEVPLEADDSILITRGALKNAAFPGSTYDGIRLTGTLGGGQANIVLPVPASLAESYTLEIENRSGGFVGIRRGAVATPYSGVFFVLRNFQALEVSLEEEIQEGGTTIWTYRTRVRVTPDGVYRVPGFTSA